MLVFEDVHWADRSSRDFLAFFVRNARHQRVLLVATYRTDELHRRHPAAGAGGRSRARPDRRARRPWSASRARRSSRSSPGSSGAGPRRAWSTSSSRRAEGNPFFTEELAAAATGERLPANVADALMLRVEALSPPAQAVLRFAAVAGPAREPRAARARGRRSRPTSSWPDCARRWRTTSSCRTPRPTPTASATRSCARRWPTTCCPASAGRCTPRWPARWRPIRRCRSPPAASPRSSPSTGSRPTTSRRRSPPRRRPGAEAMRLAAFAEANAHYERAIELWDGVPEDVRARRAEPRGPHPQRRGGRAPRRRVRPGRGARRAGRCRSSTRRRPHDRRAGRRAPRALPVDQRELARGAGRVPRRGRPPAAGRRPRRPCPRARLRGPPAPAARAREPRRSSSASRRWRSRAPPARAARRAASSARCAPR